MKVPLTVYNALLHEFRGSAPVYILKETEHAFYDPAAEIVPSWPAKSRARFWSSS
jgi:hypothetical protein